MTVYYNEYDPVAAAWLRELIKRGLIADGVVDERSIVDVAPEDLQGFTQCHFFAGIGGWSYALRLAGWPDDQPVWTGSPPCQPFSLAGQKKGQDDERHLAPHFAALVAAGRPPILFGEQVASAAVFGKPPKRTVSAPDAEPQWAWIDDLFGRLEAAHYACGTADLPAAGVGAPHIRQRTFFGAVRLADADDTGSQGRERIGAAGTEGRPGGHGSECSEAGGLADAEGAGSPHGGTGAVQPLASGSGGTSIGLADAERPRAVHGGWADADWLFCRDGKWRPVEPSTFPLAHGLPARVGRLRGYGNAIVPQAAAEFVKAFTQALEDIK